MTKLVSAYVVTKAPSKFDLVRSVNEADGEGFLSGIAKRAGQAVGITPKKPEEPEERELTDQSQPSMLNRIISEITTPPGGSVRFVLHLSHRDLTTFYLKGDIGARVALINQMVESGELAKIIANPMAGEASPSADAREVHVLSAASLQDRSCRAHGVDGHSKDAGRRAWLNPREQRRGQGEGHVEEMFSYNNYVMTINNAKSAKEGVTAGMDTGDEEAKKLKFNPNVIENYPDTTVLGSAKEDWDELHAGEAEKREREEVEANKKKAAEPAVDTHGEAEGQLAASARETSSKEAAQRAAAEAATAKGSLAAIAAAYQAWSSQRTKDNDEALKKALAKAFPPSAPAAPAA
jgi:hypothetical protein